MGNKKSKSAARRALATPGATSGQILVCMPFRDEHSDELLDTLVGYCRSLGLTLKRADQLASGKDILTNITKAIDTADAIVVDLTGCNSNVMYELGILDDRKKPAVLLARRGSSLCADIRSRNYISFGNLAGTEGRRNLVKKIDRWLEDSGVVRPDTIIRGKLKRTMSIVSSLRDLLRRDPAEFAPFSVRFSGGLSAFAISDKELQVDAKRAKGNEKAYLKELARERDLLIEAASRGHRMRCLIYSPASQHEILSGSKLRQRIKYLAQFMSNRNQNANNQIEWKIATYRPSNTYIIGNYAIYEGFKKDGSRGYPLTLRTVDGHAIHDRAKLFDDLFDATFTKTKTRPETSEGNRAEHLRQAAIDHLHRVLAKVKKKKKS